MSFPKILRKLRWQPALLVVSLALTGLTLYLAATHYHVPPEQKELFRYVKRVFPNLHQVTRSIQAGIAGLIDQNAPSAEEAVRRIDEEILPSIDEVLARGRQVALEGVETRGLHLGYLRLCEDMRADVLAIRGIFADPGLELDEKRRQSQLLVKGIAGRGDAFAQSAAKLLEHSGIEVTR